MKGTMKMDFDIFEDLRKEWGKILENKAVVQRQFLTRRRRLYIGR
jgi:hypothetical protein